MKTESQLTAVCLKELRLIRGAVVLKHADRFTSGVPDASFTQRGRCFVVLYDQESNQTHLIRPRDVRKNGTFIAQATYNGMSHLHIAEYIAQYDHVWIEFKIGKIVKWQNGLQALTCRRLDSEFQSMTMCEHANESARGICKCSQNCSCRERMCK
jgi:hypothetical protein